MRAIKLLYEIDTGDNDTEKRIENTPGGENRDGDRNGGGDFTA